jgi:phosphopantothenoylcysteine decarboxylase/phosphopantothenate--cysteine ligase
MAEPEEIISWLFDFFARSNRLAGKKVLVTAGPTYENIDPVRFIGNYSSGKMGFALAAAFADHGADVTLITGPTHLQTHAPIRRIDVRNAQQMFDEAAAHFAESDITVMSAAVADYTPAEPNSRKIKKQGDEDLNIVLRKTKDILAELGQQKRPGQLLVGFALETHDEEQNARLKLEKKNLDMIVLNSLNDAGAGFGHDTNKISILDKNGSKTSFDLKTKAEVAADIINLIIEKVNV